MNRTLVVKSPQTLREALERSVRLRTGGLIRGLRVDVRDGTIVLTGIAPTYYAKQLASHAALSSEEPLAVVNNIEVC